MDINILSTLLQQFMKESGKASIPGLGTFILKEFPSELLDEGKMIMPPRKGIVFESTYSEDGLLESTYSKMYNVSLEKSRNEINALSIQMKKELMSGYKLNIPHFGILCFNEGYEFSFKPDESLNYIDEDYGLEPIIFKKENDALVFDTNEDSEIVSGDKGNIGNIEDAEIADNAEIEDSIEIAEISGDVADKERIEVPENMASIDGLEKIENSEDIKCDESIGTTDEIESVEDTEDVELPEVVEVSNEKENLDSTENKEEISELNSDNIVESEYSYNEREDVKEKIKRSLFIFMWIVIALVLLAVLIYIFQEPLKPLLEKIFYTKEELETIMYFRQ